MKEFFIPPKFEAPLAWAFDLAFPILSRSLFNLQNVYISELDARKLRTLSRERVLYFSNHPTTIEPPVAYYVANKMGSRFHFMASRNVFDWGEGFVGEVIRRVGAFSVLSGGADKDAIKMSRKILSTPQGKLAIYPEGMCSGENDNLLPFLPGTAQIGFWGLEDARKQEPNADIIVLPAFVKYILTGTRSQLLEEIESSIDAIERELHLNPGNRNLLRRFLMVGRFLLERTEEEYKISPTPDQDYEYRVGRVRHETLNRAGNLLNLQFDPEANAIDKIRELFTVLDAIEAGFSAKGQKPIPKPTIRQARIETEKAYTFLVTKPHHLVSYPTAERFVEWLTRYETLLFGKSAFRPREAHVQFAPFFRLGEYWESYKKDKKSTVQSLTNRLRTDLETLLKKSIPMTSPIVTPEELGEI